MFKMVSRHHNQVFTNQRMPNQGKSTRFARNYKVTIVGEDKGEGRHTGSLHSLCCRGRSCSSRTSQCPPRSCSSRTPCSTPGRGRGLNPCSQCERYTCCRDFWEGSVCNQPCPWSSILAPWSRLLGKNTPQNTNFVTERLFRHENVWDSFEVIIDSLFTFVISDEAGPVAQVLVAFDNFLVSVIVAL